jgi:hypothetical protein
MTDDDLRARLDALEQEVARMRKEGAGRHHASRTSRRSAIVAAVLLVFAAGAAFAHLADATGEVLRQYMDYSTPHITPPPLDTMVRWQRRDREGALLGQTNQILSLIADANQKNSHTWPLYIQLAGTTDPTADANSSQSVGSTVRGFNRSIGSTWMAGHHSEIYHGQTALNGSQVETNGTSILFNGELASKSQHGATIGLNIQNTPLSTTAGTHAINIQSSPPPAVWQNGIHFDSPGYAGNIGINFGTARYNMGIELGENSLRINAGQKVVLEKFGQVYLWYNPATARIELVKSGLTVASW